MMTERMMLIKLETNMLKCWKSALTNVLESREYQYILFAPQIDYVDTARQCSEPGYGQTPTMNKISSSRPPYSPFELHDFSRPILIVATRRHDEQDGHNPGWVVPDHHGGWGDDQAAAAPCHLCRLGNQLAQHQEEFNIFTRSSTASTTASAAATSLGIRGRHAGLLWSSILT